MSEDLEWRILVARRNDVVSSPTVGEVEECIGDIADPLNRNVCNLEVTGSIIHPVGMIQNDLVVAHFDNTQSFEQRVE